MNDKNALLRSLPKVDEIIQLLAPKTVGIPRAIVKRVVQEEIEKYRVLILANELSYISATQLDHEIYARICKEKQYHLRGVINATGVVLHTNLGRAKLMPNISEQLNMIATSYSNLEYDLVNGQRGSRYDHVEELIKQITGAQAAIVVNNNAAAVYLILDSIAKGKEVVISRGELVEIGGSFRIPNIMETSGCKLVEVGTTNKTHLSDYAENITEETAAILKVHTSNYKIIGFTENVPLEKLNGISKKHDLPLIYDLGSGLMLSLKSYGISDELTVAQCVEHCDILCFSGDKLLGGPQAGIIVGSERYINKMKKNHLLRALRIDKLTLAALEATLWQYLEPETAFENIPTLRMITAKTEELHSRAKAIFYALDINDKICFSIVETSSQIGGGTMPDILLDSYAISIQSDYLSATALEEIFRQNETPIITRISKNQILLDVRTIDDEEIPAVVKCINKLLI